MATALQVPTIGRTVLYQANRETVWPATVLKVVDPDTGSITLAVLTESDFVPVQTRRRILPGAPGEVDTWHWPPRS